MTRTLLGDIWAAVVLLWCEIKTPSEASDGGHSWGAVALGHVMLGALVATQCGALALPGAFLGAAAYWGLKEIGDLRAGGGLVDGLLDAGFVGLGLLYAGPIWWPLLSWALVLIGSVAASYHVVVTTDWEALDRDAGERDVED